MNMDGIKMIIESTQQDTRSFAQYLGTFYKYILFYLQTSHYSTSMYLLYAPTL
jgi:hypothetical protein